MVHFGAGVKQVYFDCLLEHDCVPFGDCFECSVQVAKYIVRNNSVYMANKFGSRATVRVKLAAITVSDADIQRWRHSATPTVNDSGNQRRQ